MTRPGLISGQLDRFASLRAARSALTAHATPGMPAHLDLYALDGPAMLAAAEELLGGGGTHIEKN